MLKLSALFCHPRNYNIKFDPKNHEYLVNGRKISKSVSQLKEVYFPTSKFNPHKVIRENYDKWAADPKSKYAHIFEKHGKHNYIDVSAEIMKQWRGCATKGTNIHSFIEKCLDNEAHLIIKTENERNEFLKQTYTKEAPCEEIAQWFRWRLDNTSLMPVSVEWKVYSEEMDLAGQIDAFFVEWDYSSKSIKKYVIVDWKRVAEIRFSSFVANDYGVGPFSKYPNCNYSHFCCQLNHYLAVLNKHYGFNPDIPREMRIVQIHPELDDYKEFIVPKNEKIV